MPFTRTVSSTRPTVVFHRCDPNARPDSHDLLTKASVARSLADLLGLEFAGVYDPAHRPPGPLYFVPSDTLSLEQAWALGIDSADDLFGGVVPHPFVATKLVTHPLVHASAQAPEGWSTAYGDAVRDVVLPGYSVFSADDARAAGQRLFAEGSVRLKMPDGVGGLGQQVMHAPAELEAWIAETDPEVLRRLGVVLERNLREVETLSVGQVCVGSWKASYVGTQSLVRNHHGHEVYGGSTLTVVLGDFEALRAIGLPTAFATAVEQALVYHRAAACCYPGWMASRANYDIAQGVDDRGQARSGVLEQSWRIGGASGAEVAALHAFNADPGLRMVHASTHEVYADDDAPIVPPGAHVHYDGTDAHVGRLTKYAVAEPASAGRRDAPGAARRKAHDASAAGDPERQPLPRRTAFEEMHVDD